MTRTVDIVIVGGNAAAVAATIDAVRRGLRVLVVIRRRGSNRARRLRRSVATACAMSPEQLSVVTGAEVACADGVKSIEAVVVRQLRSRRLIGVNASEMLNLEGRGCH